MSETGTADSFIQKWLRRWPEWSIAEAFVPAAQRETARAWFALMQTLAEAAWGGSDPTPGLAKLAWWHEELEGWAKGARRHPLGELLQPMRAPWSALGRELNALPATRGQAPEHALEALAMLGSAVSACESALFPENAGEPEPTANAPAAASAAMALLGERALLAADRDDAGWLLGRWPRPPAGKLPRRLQAALLRARLGTLAAGKPADAVPGWRVLATSWQASRGR